MTTTEMKTLTCPGPPEHEFQIPKGRGRPPRYCDEHKKNAAPQNGNHSDQGEKMETQTRPRPRPRPGQKPEPEQKPPEQPKEEQKLPPVAKPDTGSRAKAETAAKRASTQADELLAWPVNPQGKPLTRIVFSASELVPTGQYANVSIGPAQITAFIDLDREVPDEEGYFKSHERNTLVKAINELAEVVERDIIAVQRNLVLESMQEQLSS